LDICALKMIFSHSWTIETKN